ncbi:MAG: polysaccharide pyruvyl transferase family protein, partial [Spirochaetaceae bacterium]|nr:polysaccharide pyruvyl transferase family protein [Spirochaetaceae bacterium]
MSYLQNIKKVAITTWWHYHNYGSSLQVVALYNVIKYFGFDVDVINYIPSIKKRSLPKLIKSITLKRIIARFKEKRIIDIVRDEKFDSFIENQLTFTANCTTECDFENLNEQYDIFICGSDQIWTPIVFDPRYFLDFIKDDNKKIAYAPSIGVSVIENKHTKECMKNLISSFPHLSTREKQGAEIIHKLCSKNALVVLDPTLLFDYEQWHKIIPSTVICEKYILCYFLGTNKNSWKHVAAISKKLNLPIKILPIFVKDARNGEIVYGAGIVEFFNLIDNAKFVCTDSFHGMAFSIICGKPFYVFERFHGKDKQSQNSRVYNLLDITCLNNRLIRYDEPLKKD